MLRHLTQFGSLAIVVGLAGACSQPAEPIVLGPFTTPTLESAAIGGLAGAFRELNSSARVDFGKFDAQAERWARSDAAGSTWPETQLADYYGALADFLHGYYRDDTSCTVESAVSTMYAARTALPELTYGDCLRLMIIETPVSYEQSAAYGAFRQTHPGWEQNIRQTLRVQPQIGYAYSLQHVSLCSVAQQLHWGIVATIEGQKAAAARRGAIRTAIQTNVDGIREAVRKEYAAKTAAQKARQAEVAAREGALVEDYLETVESDQLQRREFQRNLELDRP